MLLGSGKTLVFYLWIGLIFSCQTKSIPMTGSILAGDKSTIAYKKSGHGDTTLLFVHGWCINKDYWQYQFDFFDDRYTVVAIDLPGFGQSSKQRISYDFDQYADDVIQCIDQLALNKVILIGHSMSGDIILKADTKPSSKIVGIIGIDNLHSPSGEQDSTSKANAVAYFDYMLAQYDSAVINGAKPYLFQPTTPDSIISRVMQDILATPAALSVNVLRALDDIGQLEKSLMRQLHHRLVLVNSDVSPVALDSLNAYCAKGVKLFTVHATGHYPMIEKPGEFNRALQQAIWNQ
ncbi:MAG: alpha/beta hydrolase [Saprospiraceae bacterium]|nr:alpha/beta hydrolase [Saprospiraceae bacterium]